MKVAGKKTSFVIIVILLALIVLMLHNSVTQDERIERGMSPVGIEVILGLIIMLIVVCSSHWFLYYYPVHKRDEVLSKFNSWKQGNTSGAKFWRGFKLVALICLIIQSLLRALGLMSPFE